MNTNISSSLPLSQVDLVFAEKTLWKQGLSFQAMFTQNDLDSAMCCQTFEDVRKHMQRIISRSFLGKHFYFILGPITPAEDSAVTIENNLWHFLCAYRFHCMENGRKVFPQFLYAPIISHIAEKRVVDGEPKVFVYESIMSDIFKPLFDSISKEQKPDMVSGVWLDSYQDSRGALIELEIFKSKGWQYILPEKSGHTQDFYTLSCVSIR